MIALDYFLYDNRTWVAAIGRDWGIKAATGALTARPDLRSMFERYCTALPGDFGQLSGFEQALGGIRPPNGDGYLLCLTVETTDSFGRPSWAIYGLWCPNTKILESVLAGNLLSSGQAALRVETPPATFALKSFGLSLKPGRCLRRENPAFIRFDRKSSVSDVISLLVGAIRHKDQLPDVLGITASSRLSLLGQQFRVIYCHPLDERGERAFAQHRSVAPPPENDAEEVVASRSSRSRCRTTVLWASGSVAGVTILAIAFMFASETWPQWMVLYTTRVEPPLTRSRPYIRPGSTEAVLLEIRAHLDAIRALDPEDLRQAALKEQRRKTRDAYSDLIKDRERVVGRAKGDDIAYYYEARQIRSFDASTRLQKIRLILDERPFGGDSCKDIGIESAPVRSWCDSLTNLERTASSLRQTHSSAASGAPGSPL